MAYPMFLFLHTVGLGFLVGTSTAMGLRVLGFGRQMSMAPMERFLPVLWFGFWTSAISGVVIWSADASKFTFNPMFWLKMGAIVLAMLSVRLLRGRVFGKSSETPDIPSTAARGLALATLVFWALAITAGRLTAYLGS